jgi:hypothetical protein
MTREYALNHRAEYVKHFEQPIDYTGGIPTPCNYDPIPFWEDQYPELAALL